MWRRGKISKCGGEMKGIIICSFAYCSDSSFQIHHLKLCKLWKLKGKKGKRIVPSCCCSFHRNYSHSNDRHQCVMIMSLHINLVYSCRLFRYYECIRELAADLIIQLLYALCYTTLKFIRPICYIVTWSCDRAQAVSLKIFVDGNYLVLACFASKILVYNLPLLCELVKKLPMLNC